MTSSASPAGGLPASGFGVPISGRLTPTGQIAEASQIMIDAATGLLWKLTVAGSPPAWAFTAAPSCDEIALDFPGGSIAAGCDELAGAVGTCTQLLSWGYS